MHKRKIGYYSFALGLGFASTVLGTKVYAEEKVGFVLASEEVSCVEVNYIEKIDDLEKVIDNGWVREENGWHYYENGVEYKSKGVKIEECWYYFDDKGVSVRNYFRQIGEEWYYYDEKGHLLTDTEEVLDGKHYRFKKSGATY